MEGGGQKHRSETLAAHGLTTQKGQNVFRYEARGYHVSPAISQRTAYPIHCLMICSAVPPMQAEGWPYGIGQPCGQPYEPANKPASRPSLTRTYSTYFIVVIQYVDRNLHVIKIRTHSRSAQRHKCASYRRQGIWNSCAAHLPYCVIFMHRRRFCRLHFLP